MPTEPEPESEPVPTPEGWTLIVAFSTWFTVSRIWLRDVDGTRQYMADIDRSGFDGMFEEDDWSEFPRYESGEPRSSLQAALGDANDAWVLGMPCAPVYADYADYFAAQIVEAAKVEDTFTGAWLKACEAGRAEAAARSGLVSPSARGRLAPGRQG